MPFLIPQSIPGSSSELEFATAELLRKCLPDHCALWHQSALDGLENDERVPFLLMGEDIGIAAITPLAWQSLAPVGAIDQQQEHSQAAARVARLRELLRESYQPHLLTHSGDLRPAFHSVFVLPHLRGKDVSDPGWRAGFGSAIVVAQGEIDQIYPILRQLTQPGQGLTDEDFATTRSIVSPTVEIRLPHRNHSAQSVGGASGTGIPQTLDLPQEQVVKSFAHLPDGYQALPRDLDTRLVRGVVGSGKSLILLHRAKFLSQIYPDWRILVVTYNRSLADFLRNRLKDLPGETGKIEISNFHAWARTLLYDRGLWPPNDFKPWERRKLLIRLAQRNSGSNWMVAEPDYFLEELDWIRDQGFTDWDQYAKAQRLGRGRPLQEGQRRQVWDLLQSFRQQVKAGSLLDWSEIPLLILGAVQSGVLSVARYHAILVDEAQDFAPSWFMVLQRLLKPETNMLFMAADAAQKIYRRSLSWRALGIDVTGNRSRVLNRSYRNTYEILRLAYRLVGDDAKVLEDIRREGDDLVTPELNASRMRRGPRPVILQFANPAAESTHIAGQLHELHQQGFRWNEMAVIHREHSALQGLDGALKASRIPTQIVKGRDINLASDDVKLITLHSSKGLEFSAVFVTGADRVQPRPGLTGEELDAAIAEEKRLLYVGMTRARQFLFISHTGQLPLWVAAALSMVDSE
jgi:hypothetical protein